MRLGGLQDLIADGCAAQLQDEVIGGHQTLALPVEGVQGLYGCWQRLAGCFQPLLYCLALLRAWKDLVTICILAS